MKGSPDLIPTAGDEPASLIFSGPATAGHDPENIKDDTPPACEEKGEFPVAPLATLIVSV